MTNILTNGSAIAQWLLSVTDTPTGRTINEYRRLHDQRVAERARQPSIAQQKQRIEAAEAKRERRRDRRHSEYTECLMWDPIDRNRQRMPSRDHSNTED